MSYFLILNLKNIYMLERKNDDHFFADWLLYSTHEIMGSQATYFLEIDKTTTKTRNKYAV